MAEAYSVDGRAFAFRADVAEGILPGHYVTLSVPKGAERLGRVLDNWPVPGEKFSTPLVEGRGSLVQAGEPFVDAKVRPADPGQVTAALGLEAGLTIGHLTEPSESPATLRPEGFARHTFVCGQSGSGKTYTTGVILERLLHETSLPMVILDPNSDYIHLSELRPRSELSGAVADGEDLAARHRELAQGIEILGRTDGDLRLWLGNLTLRQQAIVLGLDPTENAEEFDTAMSVVEDLGTSRFNPTQLRRAALARDSEPARRLALRIGNLRLDRMSIWADEANPAIRDRIDENARALIFDLGNFDRPVERSIVSAAIVSYFWSRRHERRPVLLVIDEAHNVCPQHPSDPHLALATEHLIAIAGEGRKFGIYLMLATQRPDKIHENVLSQCDNLILMRMNSRSDIQTLTSVFSAVPPALIERSAHFHLGEGLAYGKIAPNPLLFKTGKRITPEGGKDIPAEWIGV